jgi:hypothetical protein
MFEQPLLVTFYECKKLAFKDPRRSTRYLSANLDPQRAFENGFKGLVYLRDETYSDDGKRAQYAVLDGLLGKLKQLYEAASRKDLDKLIIGWVQFVLPADLKRVTGLAAADHDIKACIRTNWPKDKPEMAEEWLARDVSGLIYDKYYKTGGGPKLEVPGDLATKAYNAKVESLGQQYRLQAMKQKRGDNPGYFKFYPNTARCTLATSGRVYIHLKADPDGKDALGALKVLLQSLTQGTRSKEDIRNTVTEFKICDLRELFSRLDNAVVYTTTYQAAKELAAALASPLSAYTADGVPAFVKPVARGIGVAAQPVERIDKHKQPEEYSYGEHRSEIVARGLIAAASPNGILPEDVNECWNAVAGKFADCDISVHKPYKPGVQDLGEQL